MAKSLTLDITEKQKNCGLIFLKQQVNVSGFKSNGQQVGQKRKEEK